MISKDTIEVIGFVMVSIAAIVVAIVKVCKFLRWRKRAKIDSLVAQKITKSTINININVINCRNNTVRIEEYPKEYQKNDLTPKEEAEAYRHAFQNRWNRVDDAIKKFNLVSSGAEVLWFKSLKPQTSKLHECLNELKHAINEVVDDKISNGNNFKENPEHGKKMKYVVFAGFDPEDKFSKRFAKAIADIEDEVHPYLNQHIILSRLRALFPRKRR